MKLRRPYLYALAVALVLGVGYVGTAQVQAAMERADAKAEAAEMAASDAEFAAFRVKAEKLAARLPVPAGFKVVQPRGTTSSAPTPPSVCNPAIAIGVDALCLETIKPPREAHAAVLSALRPLGPADEKTECGLPPESSAKVRARFGNTTPCNTLGTLGGLTFSLSSFPQLDRERSTAKRTVFDGTLVTLGFVHIDSDLLKP